MSKKLTYQGEKLPFKISFVALKNFEKETGINFMGLKEDLSLEEVEALFYHSYLAGCKAEAIAPKYTREETEAVLESIFLDFMQLIPELIEAFFSPQMAKKTTKKGK